MRQVADEHDLEIFDAAAAPSKAPVSREPVAAPAKAPVVAEEDDLARRLAALEN